MRRVTKIIIAVICIAAIVIGALFLVCKINGKAFLGMKEDVPYGWGKEATVILLAGQSNAAGCSSDEYLRKNVSEEKYAEYKRGYDNVYINYFSTGTNESQTFVKCAAKQGEFGEFFGPELGLAEKLSELYPDRKFFIIKYAWSGTDLNDLWHSPTGYESAGQLYQGLVEYTRSSIEHLEARNYKVKLEAMCWMQGESDSIDEVKTQRYEQNLINFVSDLRTEFSYCSSEDGMAFVDAYIADSFFWKYYLDINRAKQAVADSSPMNSVIDTIAAGLSITGEPEGNPDIAHYDSMSELKLGYLFAEECSKFFDRKE